MPASEADDLVAALETGAVAGAQSEVVEFDEMAPASQDPRFADGWDDGEVAVSQALVASPTGSGPGGRAGRPGPVN